MTLYYESQDVDGRAPVREPVAAVFVLALLALMALSGTVGWAVGYMDGWGDADEVVGLLERCVTVTERAVPLVLEMDADVVESLDLLPEWRTDG